MTCGAAADFFITRVFSGAAGIANRRGRHPFGRTEGFFDTPNPPPLLAPFFFFDRTANEVTELGNNDATKQNNGRATNILGSYLSSARNTTTLYLVDENR